MWFATQHANVSGLHTWLLYTGFAGKLVVCIQHTMYIHTVIELVKCCGELGMVGNMLAHKLADDASKLG